VEVLLPTSLLKTTVASFKVLPLGSCVPMPAPSPPLKTILDLVLWNGLQSCHCINPDVIKVIKVPFKYQEELQTADVSYLFLRVFRSRLTARTLPTVATCVSFNTHMPECGVRVRFGVKVKVHVHTNRRHLLARNVFGKSCSVL
jgi:hypothetical protein